MVPTRQVDLEMHMADLLLKSQAALDELYRYYQVGRHQGEFAEKSYFLLSHCANLLFSIWLSENEAPSGLFEYSSSLHALNANVDLGSLRYTDYVRRTVHADALQEHVKNEPKWFNFWLKILETQDGTRPLDCRQFSQTILEFVGHSGFLEGKIPRRTRKGVADFLKNDTVARIFQQSMSVLEELIAAIVFRFTRLNQSHHTTEQLVSLICMLHQVRRTIINQVPAEGPYILLSNKDWGIPSALFRVYSGRMRGRLKVVSKRDGGSVVCVYTWTSGAESKRRSWTRDFSALTRPYEELLFKTWSHETGEPLNHPEASAVAKACWVVQNAEARRLRIIFRNIETISQALVRNPLCTGLAADIGRLTKCNPDDWCRTELPWTYIKELDQLLNKVKFAYREATVLGGDNPGAEVISNMWPPEQSLCKLVEQPVWHVSHVTERSEKPQSPAAAGSPDPALPAEEIGVEVPPHQDRDVEQGQASITEAPQAEQPEEPHTETPTPAEPVAPEHSSEEPQAETEAGVETPDRAEPVAELDDEAAPEQSPDEPCAVAATEEAHDTPLPGDPTPDSAEPIPGQATEDSSTEQLSEGPSEELRSSAVVAIATSDRLFCEHLSQKPNGSSGTSQEFTNTPVDTDAEGLEPADKAKPTETYHQLLDRLLEHHQLRDGHVCSDPLSLKQLQQGLAWKASQVQRTMTDIFGRRPFTAYKKKCSEGVLADFLEACDRQRTDPTNRPNQTVDEAIPQAV